MTNPERGEVDLTVGDVTVTLAPEFHRFGALSSKIRTKSTKDLIERISGLEVETMYACVDIFTSQGNLVALKQEMERLGFDSLRPISDAMNKIIALNFNSQEGGQTGKNDKPEAAKD